MGPSTGTCQYPTLRKHTDEHRGTNIEQNFKSPSTISQPPPEMGLIYMKKGNRVEEEINHKIIIYWKWGWFWVRLKSEFGTGGEENYFRDFTMSLLETRNSPSSHLENYRF